jgi:hypothetical protein
MLAASWPRRYPPRTGIPPTKTYYSIRLEAGSLPEFLRNRNCRIQDASVLSQGVISPVWQLNGSSVTWAWPKQLRSWLKDEIGLASRAVGFAASASGRGRLAQLRFSEGIYGYRRFFPDFAKLANWIKANEDRFASGRGVLLAGTSTEPAADCSRCASPGAEERRSSCRTTPARASCTGASRRTGPGS